MQHVTVVNITAAVMVEMFFCVYSRGLDTLRKKGKSSTLDLPIDSVSLSLQDLIGYFQPPGDHLEHEDKQNRLRALKNRQNLFQEEVGVSMSTHMAVFVRAGSGVQFRIKLRLELGSVRVKFRLKLG